MIKIFCVIFLPLATYAADINFKSGINAIACRSNNTDFAGKINPEGRYQIKVDPDSTQLSISYGQIPLGSGGQSAEYDLDPMTRKVNLRNSWCVEDRAQITMHYREDTLFVYYNCKPTRQGNNYQTLNTEMRFQKSTGELVYYESTEYSFKKFLFFKYSYNTENAVLCAKNILTNEQEAAQNNKSIFSKIKSVITKMTGSLLVKVPKPETPALKRQMLQKQSKGEKIMERATE